MTPIDPTPYTEEEIPVYYTDDEGNRSLSYEQPPRPAIKFRQQNDGLGDLYSEMSRIDTGRETPTRQEFAHEADIRNILGKYGVPMHQEPPQAGTTDYNLDLQAAIMAVDAAKRATYGVPTELISTFPTWVHLMKGVESGEYQAALTELNERKAQAAKTEAETAPKAP